MDNKTKLGRFVNGLKGVPANRRGHCNPYHCETLDGRKGAACCKLGYTCPMLQCHDCGIYNLRPNNCVVFPQNPEDLKLVKNCSYYFLEE